MSDFGRLASSLDPPMAVVTTVSLGGERSGCLVGFHCQCSIDPPRYAVWLSKANHTYRVGLLAERFAVHWLSDADLDLAAHFGTQSGDDVDKFAGLDWHDGGGGVPVLDRVGTRLVGRRHAVLDDGSDHVLVVLDRLETTVDGDLAPLRLTDAEHLDPGHDADDRQT